MLSWLLLGINIAQCCISTKSRSCVTVEECWYIAKRLQHCRLIEKQKTLKESPNRNRMLHSALFCCFEEFCLYGQESYALLWRQWVCVELLMVYLITVAQCISMDWLRTDGRLKHIWECQHVHCCILLVSLSMHSSFIYSLVYMHAEHWCACQCPHCIVVSIRKVPQSPSILHQSTAGTATAISFYSFKWLRARLFFF